MLFSKSVRVNSLATLANSVVLGSLLTLAACSKQEPESQASAESTAASIETDIAQAEIEFWQANIQQIDLMIASSSSLQTNIRAFLSEPTQTLLEDAQNSLQNLKLETLKLSSLTLLQQSAPEVFPDSMNTMFRVAAQPIQPGYLDRFGPYQYSGLVYDIGFKLNAETLVQQHGLTDTEEVVLGLYAIEFMLFGENGGRSAQDYDESKQLSDAHREQQLANITEIPNNRRRKLLELQSEILIDDLKTLKQQISESNAKDKQRWRALKPQQQISKIRTSLQSGITQSLVNLADIQSSAQKEQDIARAPEANSVEQDSDLPSQERAAKPKPKLQVLSLIQKIEAMKTMTPYLSEVERLGTRKAFGNAIEQLQSLDFDQPEALATQLQDTYTQLKSAL